MTPEQLDEKNRRIRISLAAYAYELADRSIMSDPEYDRLSKEINLEVPTDRPDLDTWFKRSFKDYTGMWIYSHPELDKIAALYTRLYKTKVLK